MALTLACRHQAIGETRVVHRTFYTCLEWQVQESTAQLNVVKAWIKSHWLWSVLACACSESQVTLVQRKICALWLLFSWRPEIAAAWKHCSRTGDKFCDSIFRYLSDSFETSLTHQVSGWPRGNWWVWFLWHTAGLAPGEESEKRTAETGPGSHHSLGLCKQEQLDFFSGRAAI